MVMMMIRHDRKSDGVSSSPSLDWKSSNAICSTIRPLTHGAVVSRPTGLCSFLLLSFLFLSFVRTALGVVGRSSSFCHEEGSV